MGRMRGPKLMGSWVWTLGSAGSSRAASEAFSVLATEGVPNSKETRRLVGRWGKPSRQGPASACPLAPDKQERGLAVGECGRLRGGVSSKLRPRGWLWLQSELPRLRSFSRVSAGRRLWASSNSFNRCSWRRWTPRTETSSLSAASISASRPSRARARCSRSSSRRLATCCSVLACSEVRCSTTCSRAVRCARSCSPSRACQEESSSFSAPCSSPCSFRSCAKWFSRSSAQRGRTGSQERWM
mmetsp:Transcript_64721/g.200315  ORF Transcript_64721/g.200315 Transcript_64721/m.200315 type:complete len:242 (+) Transcript_64721:443-1168(+)